MWNRLSRQRLGWVSSENDRRQLQLEEKQRDEATSTYKEMDRPTGRLRTRMIQKDFELGVRIGLAARRHSYLTYAHTR